MKNRPQNDFSKLQIVCALFHEDVGCDLYYARQIKESIEATLPGEQRQSVAPFLTAAQQLLEKRKPASADAAIDHVTAPDAGDYSELALHARLLEALRRSCRFERPLLVLTGLREAICPTGKRWTAKRKAEYQAAITYVRSLCQSRTRPSSHLSLIIQ